MDAYDDEFILDDTALDGNPVADAVYKRELYIENLLNIKIEPIIIDYTGNSVGQMQGWCNKLKNIMEEPTTPVDLFAGYSRIMATATANGLNQDLAQYDNFGLSKEWWPKNIQKEFAFKDKLFIATGDVSTGTIFRMYCLFYNRLMLEPPGREDPVQLVRDKEWTIDKLIEITIGVFEDCDGDEGLSSADKTGLALDYWCFDPIIQGARFRIMEPSAEDGKYMDISKNFTSRKFDDFISYLGKWTMSNSFLTNILTNCIQNCIILNRI